ncbi:MAG: tetratricopeptide repeat protein [Phycisphaerae bacterium]|nr:tetratricopeptide repeat protein [Phycisphaerae bacterium]
MGTSNPRRSSRLARVAAALLAVPLALTAGCADTSPAAAERAAVVNGRVALGDYARPVSTRSPEAHRHFDDGLRWLYAFNHDEAVRSFTRAAEADPDCAMAWWGIAICRGPHINNPAMDEASSRQAWTALGRARAAAASATPVEQGLIEALSHRYADPDTTRPLPLDPVARAPLDRAYAQAMERLYARFPGDDDVATLTAEALMDLRPWDLYDLDGTPRPETPRIVATLEAVLARRPDHPGANHYYIHAVEASTTPQRADDAATRLRTLVPGSGHLVHMPAHIDVRLGRWNLAADQNERAMAVHRAYTRLSPRQGFYRAYMFHNQHFLAYACMMAGRANDAIANARGMVASIPAEFYDGFAPVVDAYAPITVEALLRFGRWDDILREPEPRADLPITRAFWRFARAVSLAAQGDAAAARAEQTRFRAAVAAVPSGAMMAINPAHKVLSIADRMLEGELRYREGDTLGAVEHLRAAVAVEDTLLYMEPPDWVQPVRHALGAILLDAGRAAEAADVYREDLRRWPENGWSLHGLARCEQALGRTPQAEDLRRRFARAWSRADVALETSCFCVAPRP